MMEFDYQKHLQGLSYGQLLEVRNALKLELRIYVQAGPDEERETNQRLEWVNAELDLRNNSRPRCGYAGVSAECGGNSCPKELGGYFFWEINRHSCKHKSR